MQQTSEESVARRFKLSGSKHRRAVELWDFNVECLKGSGQKIARSRLAFKSPLALETLYFLRALKKESSLPLRRRKNRNSCC